MKINSIFKNTVRIIVGTLLSTFIGIIVLLNIPYIQKNISSLVASELSSMLKTEVTIGRIDLGLLNRIIIDDVKIKDPEKNNFLKISHLTAKFELIPLFYNRINVSSIQLFSFDINTYKKNSHSPINFQFLINALSSKESKKESKLNLRINSILVRDGNLSYNVLSEPATQSKFNLSHIKVSKLDGIISLKKLTNDSINARIRRLSCVEQSGLSLNNISLRITANSKELRIKKANIELNNSLFAFNNVKIKYKKLSNILSFSNDVNYSVSLKAHTLPSDFTPFLTTLSNYKDFVDFGLELHGDNNKIKLTSFNLKDYHGINMHGDGGIENLKSKENISFIYSIGNFNLTNAAIINISKNLEVKLPELITTRDFINYKGTIFGNSKNINLKGSLSSDFGIIRNNIYINQQNKNKTVYSGKLSSNQLLLNSLLNNNSYGVTDFNIEFSGLQRKGTNIESYLKGIINTFTYKGYQYHNVSLDGIYKYGGFDGKLDLKDNNLDLALNGKFNTKSDTPIFDLKATINNFNPYNLNLTKDYEGAKFDFNIKANFTGNSIDNLNGALSIDSLSLIKEGEKEYFLPFFTLKTKYENNIKNLIISSPFISGNIEGNYSYTTLPTSFINTAKRYIPSLVNIDNNLKTSDNNFKFNIAINDGEFFSNILNIPVYFDNTITINGCINDKEKKINIDAHLPKIRYKDKNYESVSLLCNNNDESFICNLRSSLLLGSGAMLNFSVNANAKNDVLATTINWGNNTDITYSGTLSALTHFNYHNNNSQSLNANIDIQPSNVILNDSVWKIHPSNIIMNDGNIQVNNFLFEREDQFISINGVLTKNEGDSCNIDLKNINLEYLLDIVQFDDVKFAGMITGEVTLKDILRSPEMYTKIKVNDFSMNDAILGDAIIKGHLNDDKSAIVLDANIKDRNTNSTKINGFVSPKNRSLDLLIDAKGTNISLISPFVKGILSDIKGNGYGKIRLYGNFKRLDLEGDICTDLRAKVDVVNTYFKIENDSVHLKSGEISFKNTKIEDIDGNKGYIAGYLHHTKLKNLTYDLKVSGKNLLIYNTVKNEGLPFYGQVYGSGDISLSGGYNTMNVNASFKTAPKTTFTYITATPNEATNNNFITFIDKTPKRERENIQPTIYHFAGETKEEENDGPPMDLHINMSIETTPSANMKIIMDPIAGDNITATGSGNLQVSYYNKGDFRIFGNYIISEGLYKLSMQDIIRKDFTLKSGGTVSFTGDPYQANLDVQAVYTVNSASLNDLGMNMSTIQGKQSSVKVNCLMNLTGSLASPNIKFDLDLPTLNEEDKAFVRSATSTEEQMNTQIIYLLGIGKFYTYDFANANKNQQSSNATSSLAFSTLSGQLNNLLSQWTENKNWNIGANLTTGEKGWTDVEAEAMLSGRLLNNRLQVNGNFGYKDNAFTNNNFVGDFEAIWMLTENGEWRLRGYNETNDKYYLKSTLTTQGIGLIYNKNFDKWKDLFKWTSWWKTKKINKNE